MNISVKLLRQQYEKLLPKFSIREQTYLILSFVLIIPAFIFAYFETNQIRDNLILAKQARLMSIVTRLEQRIPGSFNSILKQQGLDNATAAQKIAALNEVFQPIVDDVARAFSAKYSFGFYHKELNIIAYQPKFNNSLFGKQARPESLHVYKSGNAEFSYIQGGFTQGDVRIMALNYPLYKNGELIGHAYAAIKIDDINRQFFQEWLKNFGIFFVMWLGVVGTVFISFRKINKLISKLNNDLENDNYNINSFHKYPELASIMIKVQGLKQELSLSHKRLKDIIKQCPIGIVVVDENFIIEAINEARTKIGNLPENSIGQYYFDVANTGYAKEESPIYWALKDGIKTSEYYMHRIGRDWLLNATPIYNNGRITGAIGVYQDITESRQMEDELKRREQEYKTLLDNCPYAITRWDRSHRLLYANEANTIIFGTNFVYSLGIQLFDLDLNRAVRLQIAEALNKVFQTSADSEFDTLWHKQDESYRILFNRAIPEINSNGQVDTVLVITYDITDKRLSEERFRKAFQYNPIMMFVSSIKDWKLIDVNECFLETVGLSREQIIGNSTDRIGLWADKEKLLQIRQKIKRGNGRVQNFEMQIFTKTKGIRSVLFSSETIKIGDKLCYLGMFHDITEIRRFEKEMTQLDRLNIVGELAAGIGHEVRNPLTTVRGYLQVFQHKTEFEKYQEQLNTMIEELDRANTIITEFLSLAKNKKVEFKQTNLNTILKSLFPLLQADAYRRGHELFVDFNEIPKIKVDEKEIRQLVLNLVRNSFEAMNDKGEVTIRTYQQDNFIVLEVEDNGTGIPPEVLEKIGTPFVTTKENGTGLGLPVCYRIAENHGARISLATGLQGTTFSVVFKNVYSK